MQVTILMLSLSYLLTVLKSFKRLGVVKEVVPLSTDFIYTKGDLLWIETPLNPTGEITNIKLFADIAHKAGAYVVGIVLRPYHLVIYHATIVFPTVASGLCHSRAHHLVLGHAIIFTS